MPDEPISLGYLATLQHAQWMMGSDGQYLTSIQAGCRQSAVRMFRDYNVARTVWGDEGLRKLADAVFQAFENDRPLGDMCARARWCQELAKRSDRPKGQTGRQQGAPYSAVSKLLWFLQPAGWTMYDRLAQIGLSGQNGIEQFYADLQNCGFDKVTGELNAIIAEHGFAGLYGERIVDKFLMNRGMMWSGPADAQAVSLQAVAGQMRHLLANLGAMHTDGKYLAHRLRSLAESIGDHLPNNSFCTPYAARFLLKRPI